jgi:hypothetical protein
MLAAVTDLSFSTATTIAFFDIANRRRPRYGKDPGFCCLAIMPPSRRRIWFALYLNDIGKHLSLTN